ncbi:MAG: pyridoxamine 5'-phosphate oxidase family protein [Lachnospiraceae bacterium]
MQHRMKTHPLSETRVNALLKRVQTGSLATLNADGTPYNTPVHFVYEDSCIYIHGLPKGQKIDNILRDEKVGFTAYEMQSLLLDANGEPCDTNTQYESVIVTGRAAVVDDLDEKKTILHKIVEKYTPHLSEMRIPDNMLRGTAVLKVVVTELTGKYYE